MARDAVVSDVGVAREVSEAGVSAPIDSIGLSALGSITSGSSCSCESAFLMTCSSDRSKRRRGCTPGGYWQAVVLAKRGVPTEGSNSSCNIDRRRRDLEAATHAPVRLGASWDLRSGVSALKLSPEGLGVPAVFV